MLNSLSRAIKHRLDFGANYKKTNEGMNVYVGMENKEDIVADYTLQICCPATTKVLVKSYCWISAMRKL